MEDSKMKSQYLRKSTGTNPTKTLKKISLSTKLKILSKSDNGETVSSISRELELSRSTVHSIIKCREKIIHHSQVVDKMTSEMVSRVRNPLIRSIERYLYMWIKHQREKGAQLSTQLIKLKAKSLHESLKQEQERECTFAASNGWFEGFKKRYKLRSVINSGEAASADVDEASDYVFTFREIVNLGGYSPKQVYNVDKSGLFWKRIPSRSFVKEEEDHVTSALKCSKDKLTLFLGGNAFGDAKLKPLLIYNHQNPRELKITNKDELPVLWRTNEKAWMTQDDFSHWFTSYFVPFVEEHNQRHNLDNKALLILNNAISHSTPVNNLHPHIQVIFLPPNTTSILQPINQGCIRTFKAHYLRELLSCMSTFTSEQNISLESYWNAFNIRSAIDIIGKAWGEVSQSTMRGVWHKLWPEFVNDDQHSDNINQEIASCNQEILDISKHLNLTDITSEVINNYITSHDEELTNEELLQMPSNSILSESEYEEGRVQPEENQRISKRQEKLMECMKKTEELKESIRILENTEKVRKSLCAAIDGIVSPFKEELDEITHYALLHQVLNDNV